MKCLSAFGTLTKYQVNLRLLLSANISNSFCSNLIFSINCKVTAMRTIFPIALAALATPVLSAQHSFFSGFFAGSTIVHVEFDDLTNSLTLVNNITTLTSSGAKWIAIDV